MTIAETTSRNHKRLTPFVIAQLVVAALLPFALAWFELSSVDIGYHVAYGREMLATGRILDFDPFIFAAADHRFVNPNWLTQIIIAALFDHFDWVGLFALRLALIGLTFVFLAGIVRATGGGAHAIALCWLAAAIGAYERFSMRPELFSYAILAAQIWLLMRFEARTINLIGVPLLQSLWVNLHSYFLLGPLVAAAMAVTHRLQWRRWLLLSCLQCAACLANPWFIRGAMFPIETVNYLRGEKIMAQSPADPVQSPWGLISEFQSPFGFFGFLGASRTTWAYAGLLAFAAVAAVMACIKRRWDLLLVLLIMVGVSTQMRRNVALLALFGTPIGMGMLSRRGSTEGNRKVDFDGLHARLGRVGSAAAVVVAVYWLAGIWTGQFFFSERRPARRLAAGLAEEIFPRRAVAWINEHVPDTPNDPRARRVFTDLMASSNVLPWLRPGWKVFLTTNTFAYPPSQLMRCWNVCIGREDYRALFDEYDIRVVLLRAHPPTEAVIRSLARDRDWALVHFDETYVVFLKREPEYGAVIASNEKSADDLRVRDWLDTAPRPHAVTAYRLGTIASTPFCLGWFDQARPLLEVAVRMEPGYFEAWNNLGICHAERGKRLLAQSKKWEQAAPEFKAALSCFNTVLRLDPKNAEARRNRDLTPVGVERP